MASPVVRPLPLSAALPPVGGRRKVTEPNPFVDLVTKAKKDGKRYDRPGRFSFVPLRRARRAARDSATFAAIADQLNAEGVPTARGGTR